MTKYLDRTCPKCKDYLGVVVPDPPGPKSEIPIDAYCVVCGFKLGWKVVLGGRQLEREAQENIEEGFTGFLLIGLDLHRGRD